MTTADRGREGPRRETGAGAGFRCEIVVRGCLSPTLVGEFEEFRLEAALPPVDTVLTGDVGDQAAFHGLLRRIEAPGLELVEFRRLPSSSR